MAALSLAALYSLGFVGLAAVSLIPLRSWQLFRSRLTRRVSVAGAASIALLAGLALSADLVVLRKVFQCLIGDYCGPTVAHGWIFLGMLGAAYLAFEFLVALLVAVTRRAPRGAA